MPVWAAAIAAVAGVVDTAAKNKEAKRVRQNKIDAVNAQEKARKKAINSALGGKFLGQYGLDDIFGTKPEAIFPPSVDESLTKNEAQIRGQGLPAALEFTSDINQQYADETLSMNLDRILSFIPNFNEQSAYINTASEDLLSGQLPFEDVMDIVSDRGSLAGSLGTPGGSFNASLKDLGLSRLSAIQQGQNMFQSFAQTLASVVSPIPQYARGDEILPYTSLTAQGRVQGELATVEAAQKAALIEAMADPAAAALFGEEFLFQSTAAGIKSGSALQSSVGANAFSQGATAFNAAGGAQYYKNNNSGGYRTESGTATRGDVTVYG